MQVSLWVPLLGVGLVATSSCSSTLNDFQCTQDTDCVDEQGDGVCHPSGYCAFLDLAGCDGYRFGKLSGERSGECVGAADDVDAGVSSLPDAADPGAPDANTSAPDADVSMGAPIANIVVPDLACDLTALTVNGSSSQAADGSTLTNFTWTLKAPNGTTISTMSGVPDNGFTPNRGFVSGDVEHPRVNLTPYLDRHALFIVTDGAHSLVRQTDIALQAGNHAFSYAIAAAELGDIGKTINVTVRDGEGTELASLDASLTTSMVWQTLDFTTATDMADAQISIHSDSGSYYLDNFSINKDNPSGSGQNPIVVNASIENGLPPWAASTQNGTGASVTRQDIPASLKQYGDYKLTLVVRDSEGLESAPKTVEITHEACL